MEALKESLARRGDGADAKKPAAKAPAKARAEAPAKKAQAAKK